MKSIPQELAARLARAVETAFGDAAAGIDAVVAPSQNPQFGDYQSNVALVLAKQVKSKPRDAATKIVEALDVTGICEPVDIAGPGFINFRLLPAYLAAQLTDVPPADPAADYDRLGIAVAEKPDKVVVDMSSPNLAKEMHVGHLRSTVIGESVSRILEFGGHDVDRLNHVGDWGTQFGMLVAHLRAVRPEILDNPESLRLGDLETFYVEAKKHFDEDEAFATEARQTVVRLQGGDEQTLSIWRAFCEESLRHCHAIYERLGITQLIDRGESFYNDHLAEVVTELEGKGMVQESEGAACVFLDGFVARDKTPLPMIVRKSDGGYNYATTDLAAARHRLQSLGATRVIYVVGVPQKQHFEMLFAAVRKAGWAPENVTFEHLAFGSMLGGDGKPFKTREGGTVKLKNLLDEAVDRARKVVEGDGEDEGKSRDLSDEQKTRIAEVVGTSAIKYFDLSHNLTTDYRFEWENMLSLDGNTAPYMLYAYARIRSIGRKAGVDYTSLPADAKIIIEHDAEATLARVLLRFPEIVAQLGRDLRPNILTDYLFEVSKAFSRFYDRKHGVRVIDVEDEAVRISRLRLCDLTARTLKTGLQLLGIETLEQM